VPEGRTIDFAEIIVVLGSHIITYYYLWVIFSSGFSSAGVEYYYGCSDYDEPSPKISGESCASPMSGKHWRKNALLQVGNKSDGLDARKLSELLRSNLLRSVYHEDTGMLGNLPLRSPPASTRPMRSLTLCADLLRRRFVRPMAGRQTVVKFNVTRKAGKSL
jgi:hypothetical protein